MMHHYVVTRLNMRIADYRPLTDEDVPYMLYRCAIFERTCRPSLANQSFQKFTHLILHAPDLPEEVMKRMATYQNNNTVLVPVAQTDTCPRADLAAWLQQQHEPGERIATTMLDSDDMLHRQFLWTVENTRDFPGVHLCRPSEVFMLHENGVCVARVSTPPMFSLQETLHNDMPLTCFRRGHTYIAKDANAVLDVPVPALMLGHASNMVTRPQAGHIHLDTAGDYGVSVSDVKACIQEHETTAFIRRESDIRGAREAKKRAAKNGMAK